MLEGRLACSGGSNQRVTRSATRVSKPSPLAIGSPPTIVARTADSVSRSACRPPPAALRRRHGRGDRDDLALELARADHPIDGVFQRTRQAEPALGRGDEHRVALRQRAPPSHHALWCAARIHVGIEMR